MPIYEYACQDCDQDFELLIRGDDQPVCPACGGVHLNKQFSVVAAHSANTRSLPVCQPPAASGGCGLPQCGTGGCQMG